MTFTHKKNGQLLYKIDINIKAYKEISDKDKIRINRIALLIDSLGYDKDTDEETYRFTSERNAPSLLLDVEINSQSSFQK
mgnify:FL=1